MGAGEEYEAKKIPLTYLNTRRDRRTLQSRPEHPKGCTTYSTSSHMAKVYIVMTLKKHENKVGGKPHWY